MKLTTGHCFFPKVWKLNMKCGNIVSLENILESPNILLAAFTIEDPKRAKRHQWLDCLFVLLGSFRVKSVRKHVGEIDPQGYWFIAGIRYEITEITN